MKVYETEILSLQDPASLDKAVQLIQAGELVAFPTDTVYGLACSPFNPSSLEQIYQVKQRPEEKAIPVLVANLEQVAQVVKRIPPQAEGIMAEFWPGALTLVLPHKIDLPVQLSPYPGLAVRMPRHQLALQILERTGSLAVTSANLSAHSETLSAQDVYNQLKGRIPLILDDGSHPGGKASTVIDCMGAEPVLLRQGPIAFEDIVQKWKAYGKDL
ncbi:MAG: L-threonylcarbamoyladenylate synthase [Anaerolineaceae bacterium]|jgi:L-threonylcarbamoyladenylate synthase